MRRRHSKKGLKNKFKNLSFFKKNLLVMMASLVLVCFTMVGYAALNETLNITGDLVIRANKDIRITDLKLVGTPTNAYEQYNSKYTVDTISLFPAFEGENGSISYQATITNKGSTDMEITNINKELSDDSVTCSITGLYKDTIIESGSTKTFTITLNGTNKNISEALSAGLLLEITWEQYYEKYLTYNISGNSIQNGTPSPSTPVAIESVGDRTVNLLDLSGVVIGGLAGANGGDWVTETNARTDYLSIKENTTYIVNSNLLSGYKLNRLHVYDENKQWISLLYYGSTSQPFTTPANAKYYRVAFTKEDGSNFSDVDVETLKKLEFQIQEGSVATEYEPYGYKIPIEVSGENLVDYTKAKPRNTNQTIAIDKENNAVIWNGDYFFEIPVNINSGETVTLSLESENMGNWMLLYEDRTSSGNIKVNNAFTTNKNVIAIRVYKTSPADSGENMIFKNIMLVYGTEKKDYVPYVEPTIKNIYLDEPLRKLGDYKDSIDFEDRKLNKQVSAKVTDFIFHNFLADNKYLYLKSSTYTDMLANSLTLLSNKIGAFIKFPGSADNNRLMVNNQIFYYLVSAEESETQSYIDLLSGTEIIYPLATSDSIPITLPEIIKKPYYTNMTVKTSVQPSDITYSFETK